MENGQNVRVYTDDIMGWEDAVLVDRYSIMERNILERWGIETESGAFLVRYIKNSMDLKQDGCGYLLNREAAI